MQANCDRYRCRCLLLHYLPVSLPSTPLASYLWNKHNRGCCFYKIKETREGNYEFTRGKRAKPVTLSYAQEILYNEIAELKSIVIWRMKNSQPVSPKMAHKRAKTMHVEHMDSAVTEARDQKKMYTGLQYRRIRRSLLEPANATPAPTGSADIND